MILSVTHRKPNKTTDSPHRLPAASSGGVAFAELGGQASHPQPRLSGASPSTGPFAQQRSPIREQIREPAQQVGEELSRC